MGVRFPPGPLIKMPAKERIPKLHAAVPKIPEIPKRREQRLVAFLHKSLTPSFFDSLERISNSAMVVKRLDFEGLSLAIKDTNGDAGHGYAFEKSRQSFLAHQQAIRFGELQSVNYKLHSARVLGKIGPYLIMTFMKGEPLYELRQKLAGPTNESLESALSELENNFNKLQEFNKIGMIPDITHLTAKLEKGKWIFYLPYDFM
jgi:hypothetical protein